MPHPPKDKRPSRRDFLQATAIGSLGLPWLSAGLYAAESRPKDVAQVWDVHCHLDRGFPTSPKEQMAFLVRYADRVGIDRVVILTIHDPDAPPREIVRMNDIAMKAVEGFQQRAMAFVFLNPKFPEFCLKELDRCVRDGPMVGVKFKLGKRCNAPELDPIVRRAAELQAPIYQHTWLKATGNKPGESTPMDVAELAARHPETPIICGHGGADFEPGIRAVRAHPNVSVEVGGFDPTAGFAELAMREVGADRIIYGSNAVGTDRTGRCFASALSKVTGAEIPQDAKRQILGENIRKMLRPMLKKKGLPL